MHGRLARIKILLLIGLTKMDPFVMPMKFSVFLEIPIDIIVRVLVN